MALRQFFKEKMKHKNSDADGNRAVRDIKSRPVIMADIKIQKVNAHR